MSKLQKFRGLFWKSAVTFFKEKKLEGRMWSFFEHDVDMSFQMTPRITF